MDFLLFAFQMFPQPRNSLEAIITLHVYKESENIPSWKGPPGFIEFPGGWEMALCFLEAAGISSYLAGARVLVPTRPL